VLLVDDYGDKSVNPNSWEGLPGVKMACDEALPGIRPSILVGLSDLSMVAYRKPIGPRE
jgi:O-methyltransferase